MLIIPQLSSTTPTLAEAMRTCLLSAGLSRAKGSRAFVLGNPKAWLGTAYHEVLEALPALAAEGGAPLLELVDVRWGQAIERLQQEAASHPLNHRFGPATTWRGYYLVLETLRIRAAELANDMLPRSLLGAGSGSGAAKRTLREEEFSAISGKLRGRVDLIRGTEIVDYKTGALFENDAVDAAPSLKAAYVRQLRIYSYLVQAVTGQMPERGLLYPLAGPPAAVDLDPAGCEAEAVEAVRLLEHYNSLVASAGDVGTLASPSPEACRWCQYKTICPAFWTSINEGWGNTLDGQAVSGPLTKAPQAIQGGAAWSIGLTIEAGTIAAREAVIAPLSAAVYTNISQLCQGERVQIVGLGERSNGSLFPTQRTVVLAETAAPEIKVGDQPVLLEGRV